MWRTLAFAVDKDDRLRNAARLGERTRPIGNVMVPRAVVAIAVGPDLQTSSFRLTVDEITGVAIAVGPRDRTVTVRNAMRPIALVLGAIRPTQDHVAVL